MKLEKIVKEISQPGHNASPLKQRFGEWHVEQSKHNRIVAVILV